jgi:hypothetical protein
MRFTHQFMGFKGSSSPSQSTTSASAMSWVCDGEGVPFSMSLLATCIFESASGCAGRRVIEMESAVFSASDTGDLSSILATKAQSSPPNTQRSQVEVRGDGAEVAWWQPILSGHGMHIANARIGYSPAGKGFYGSGRATSALSPARIDKGRSHRRIMNR